MTSPFPTRRSVHGRGATPAEEPAAETPLDPKPFPTRQSRRLSAVSEVVETVSPSERTDPLATRSSRHASKSGKSKTVSRAAHSSRSLKWGLLLALLMLILVALVLFGAHSLWKKSHPVVTSVEGPLDAISVAGRVGAPPVLSIDNPVQVRSLKLRVERQGAGREITADSPVLLAITAFDGKTGENLNREGEPNLVLGLADSSDLGETLSGVLVGKTEGSRVLIARPLTDGETEIDVVDILPTIASGTAVTGSEGPLTVTASDDGISVQHDPGDPPDGVRIQVLAQGEGPQVSADDAVVIQYLAGNWSDGTIIGSTWAGGAPVMIDLSKAMPGIQEALVDQRVGTRLAVTIPAEKAFGEDTLFVVVDVLGTMPADQTDGAVDEIGSESGG